MSPRVAEAARSDNVRFNILPAILPSTQVLCGALQSSRSTDGDSVDFGESLDVVGPHREGAIEAASRLAGEGEISEAYEIGHERLQLIEDPLAHRAKRGTSRYNPLAEDARKAKHPKHILHALEVHGNTYAAPTTFRLLARSVLHDRESWPTLRGGNLIELDIRNPVGFPRHVDSLWD